LKRLRQSSIHRIFKARTQKEESLPKPIEIEDVGDIFNFKYGFNWVQEDPMDFKKYCDIPINQNG